MDCKNKAMLISLKTQLTKSDKIQKEMQSCPKLIAGVKSS